MPAELIVTTSNAVDGFRVVEYLGLVRGIAVRVPSPSQGFQALGNMLGGNLDAGADMYAEICEAARAQAHQRLIGHAGELGADAVIAMRYDEMDLGNSVTEVLAYGTAVRLASLAEQ